MRTKPNKSIAKPKITLDLGVQGKEIFDLIVPCRLAHEGNKIAVMPPKLNSPMKFMVTKEDAIVININVGAEILTKDGDEV